MEFNPNDLAHMDEMVKHSFGREELIGIAAAMKHNDNWRYVATPYDICREMCDLVVGKADKYIVFFSLEFLEVLVFEKGISPSDITFVGDFIIESELASKMYGVNVVTINKNDVIKDGEFSSDIFTFLTIDKQKEINNSESDMKFNKVAVIGNPPFQVKCKCGETTHASALYNLFVEAVIDNLKPDYFSFIITSRWMTGGRGLDKFRDRHMKKIVHFDASTVFTNVEVNGGANYFHWVKEYDGTCEFVNGNTTSHRYLNTHDVILQDNSAFVILDKVTQNASNWVSETCLSHKPFGLANNFSNFVTCGVKCICGKLEEKFVDPSEFTDNGNVLSKWKVCMGRVDNNIHREGHKYSKDTPFIIEPNAICLENYIVVKSFNNKNEAEHFISYMKTKFFRFMLSLRIASIFVNKDKFVWIPDMLDYSAPWTDAELYKTFRLTRQEVAYIESKIKAI